MITTQKRKFLSCLSERFCSIIYFKSFLGEKLVDAAKDAAKEVGGDVKQTEAELLARLLFKSKHHEAEPDVEKGSSGTKKDTSESLGTLTLKYVFNLSYI